MAPRQQSRSAQARGSSKRQNNLQGFASSVPTQLLFNWSADEMGLVREPA